MYIISSGTCINAEKIIGSLTTIFRQEAVRLLKERKQTFNFRDINSPDKRSLSSKMLRIPRKTFLAFTIHGRCKSEGGLVENANIRIYLMSLLSSCCIVNPTHFTKPYLKKIKPRIKLMRLNRGFDYSNSFFALISYPYLHREKKEKFFTIKKMYL